ncbi:MAG: VCBS repeat-containing protein, partial [Bacteroidota bacterium]
MFRFFLLTALICSFLACEQQSDSLFIPVGGVDFVNAIPENDSVNILLFEYIYNGGGVGVGDFDQDGNPDLVFAGNYVSSRIYLQKESWSFTDITEGAGLTTDVWCSGVNVADVDGNGWEDIYFTTLNPSGANDVPNRLYLNQGTNDEGIPVFREAAAEYGLGDLGYGTHSAWFDLEGDGDLDLYVLNNAIEEYNRNIAKGTDTMGKGKSVDRIYRQVPSPTPPQGGGATSDAERPVV